LTLQQLDRSYVDSKSPEQRCALGGRPNRPTMALRRVQGQTLHWQIAAIDARVSQTPAIFLVRAEFPNPDHKLLPACSQLSRCDRARRSTSYTLPRTAIVFSLTGEQYFRRERRRRRRARRQAATSNAKPNLIASRFVRGVGDTRRERVGDPGGVSAGETRRHLRPENPKAEGPAQRPRRGRRRRRLPPPAQTPKP